MPGRPRIAAIFPHPLDPGAGPAVRRAAALCAGLTAAFDVRVVTLGDGDTPAGDVQNLWGVTELRVPTTPGYRAVRQRVVERLGAPADALATVEAAWLNPRFRHALVDAVRDAEVTITVPWLVGAVRAASDAPLMLLADRSEYLARRAGYPEGTSTEALHRIATLERAACAQARWIVVPDARDAALAAALYDAVPERLVVVPPSGTQLFPDAVRPVFGDERRAIKANSSLAGQTIALVIVGDDGAEVAAVRQAAVVATGLPDAMTVVVGAAQARGAVLGVPATMKYTGRIDAGTRDLLLASADVAIVPRVEATGIDVQLADFLRRGVPVVTTRVGALGFDAGSGMIATAPDDLARCVKIVLGDAAGAERLARDGAAAFERLGDGGAGLRELCARLAGEVVAA
jgi:hypothetical protein